MSIPDQNISLEKMDKYPIYNYINKTDANNYKGIQVYNIDSNKYIIKNYECVNIVTIKGVGYSTISLPYRTIDYCCPLINNLIALVTNT